MRLFSIAFSFAFLALSAGACGGVDTDDGWSDEVDVAELGTVEQAVTGACSSVCNSTVSCTQSCYVDAAAGLQTMTCGQYGVCYKPPPSTGGSTGQQCVKKCWYWGHDGQGNPICLQWKWVCS